MEVSQTPNSSRRGVLGLSQCRVGSRQVFEGFGLERAVGRFQHLLSDNLSIQFFLGTFELRLQRDP